MADPYRAFGLSCPSGGSFYICEGNTTEFVGCCTSNPCADGSGRCPKANLQPSSFSADTYTDLPRQDCDDARSIQLWYTCKFNKPPFMGCCASNPCAQGSCPKADLVPAKLSGDVDFREPFLAATAAPGPSATATAAPQMRVTDTSPGLSTGAIVGIAVSAAVVVVALIAAAAAHRCRRRRGAAEKRDRRAPPPGLNATGFEPETAFAGQENFSPYRDSYTTTATAAGSYHQHSPLGASFPKAGGWTPTGGGEATWTSPDGVAYHYSSRPIAGQFVGPPVHEMAGGDETLRTELPAEHHEDIGHSIPESRCEAPYPPPMSAASSACLPQEPPNVACEQRRRSAAETGGRGAH